MRRVLLAMSVVLASTSTFAQEGPTQAGGLSIIAKPVWLVEPHLADLPNRFRLSDFRPNVNLICRVLADGVLSACRSVESTTPEAFLSAAVRSAETSRIASQDGDGQATVGRDIRVTVGFPIPMTIGPPEPPPNLIANPVWLEEPTPADYAAAIAQHSRGAIVSGVVTMECVVRPDGRLECRGMSTSAERADVVLPAARSLALRFRMAPQDGGAQPTAGRPVNVTIRFGATER